jgi:ATP-dependent protease Clp ATPase subunit
MTEGLTMTSDYCAFCGKHEAQVPQLVKGALSSICFECVELIYENQTFLAGAQFSSGDAFREKLKRKPTEP